MSYSISLILTIIIFTYLLHGYKLAFLKDTYKVLYISVLGLSLFFLLIKPIDFILQQIYQDKTTIYQLHQKKIYTEILDGFILEAGYSLDGSDLELYIYEGVSKSNKKKRYSIETKEIKEVSLEYPFNPNNHHPSYSVSFEKGEWKYSYSSNNKKAEIYKNEQKVEIDIYDGFKGNQFVIGNSNHVYWTKEIEERYLNIYRKNEHGNMRVSPYSGIFYSPYYWHAFNTLLYIGIVNENSKYKVNLHMHREKNTPISRFLVEKDELEPSFYKMTGNANGTLLFLLEIGKNIKKIEAFNMKGYPFYMKNETIIDPNFMALKLGYDIFINEMKEIISIQFHPSDFQKLLVLGIQKESHIPQVYEYGLEPVEINLFRQTWLDYFLVIFMLIVAGGVIFLSILIRRSN